MGSVDRTGQFEWHDHRIHWMSPVTPPQVKDTGKRTKIFDWSVPIKVGSQPGAIDGELFWVPESSKAPTGAIVALVAIVARVLAIVLLVGAGDAGGRRRRAGRRPTRPPPQRRRGEDGGLRLSAGRPVAARGCARLQCLIALLGGAPPALAHAQLLGTSPDLGHRPFPPSPRR